MIIASCLLSNIDSPTDLDRPMLPSFEFFLRSLREAMEEDDLWGAEFYDIIEPKAYNLKAWMKDLMRQCQTIEIRMTPPASPEIDPLDTCPYTYSEPVSPGMPIQRSMFAKKQVRMAREEEQWLKRVLSNRWGSVSHDRLAAPITTEFARRMSSIANEL